jgi:histidinol-phosphate aminotransferase
MVDSSRRPIVGLFPLPLMCPMPNDIAIDANFSQAALPGLPAVPRLIRLDSNEGALGPSPRAVEAYRAIAGSLHRYPDNGSTALREALAQRHGIDAGRIVCGNGSDELISLLCHTFAGTGDQVLKSRHGFPAYATQAVAAGAVSVSAPEKDLTTDVDALLALVGPKTKMVFIANPNNPTGTFLSGTELRRLHAGLPPSVLLVIDEAYAEFVTRPDYEPGLALAETAANVVVLRTFSKIFALAGLRIGWAYCGSAIADRLNDMRAPYNINSGAQAAALAALADTPALRRTREHNDIWRPWFERELKSLGVTVNPGVGNFVLLRPGTTAAHATAAHEFLRENDILTRALGGYALPEWLRVAVGTEDEMREVVGCLASFLRKT